MDLNVVLNTPTFQNDGKISISDNHSKGNPNFKLIPADLSPELFTQRKFEEKHLSKIPRPLQRLMVSRYPSFIDADILFTEPWKFTCHSKHSDFDKVFLCANHCQKSATFLGQFLNATKLKILIKSLFSCDTGNTVLNNNASCKFVKISMMDKDTSPYKKTLLNAYQKILLPLPYTSLRFVDELRAMILCFTIMGSFFYIPFALFCIYKNFCTTKLRKIFFFVILILFTAIPLQSSRRVRLWNGWKILHHYHQISTIVEESYKFPPREATLYPVMPHGIIPIAQGAVCTLGFGEFLKSTRLALATIVSYIPLYGHVCQLFGSVPASKKKIKKALEKKENVVLIPGGIAEIYDTNEKTERIRLSNRIGFLKLAIETGANVVPIYCFGNSQCFRLLPGVSLLRPLARMLRLALVFFVGRLGLPIPFKVPLLLIIGRCMNFGCKVNPTQTEIENAHQHFVSEVKRLFNTYKSVYGWDHKTIEIT